MKIALYYSVLVVFLLSACSEDLSTKRGASSGLSAQIVQVRLITKGVAKIDVTIANKSRKTFCIALNKEKNSVGISIFRKRDGARLEVGGDDHAVRRSAPFIVVLPNQIISLESKEKLSDYPILRLPNGLQADLPISARKDLYFARITMIGKSCYGRTNKDVLNLDGFSLIQFESDNSEYFSFFRK